MKIKITVNPVMFLFWIGVVLLAVWLTEAPIWAILIGVGVVSALTDQVVKFINRI
jgi:hypothetical protein